MRGLRAAGSIRANSPKLKNHRLGRWIFIISTANIHAHCAWMFALVIALAVYLKRDRTFAFGSEKGARHIWRRVTKHLILGGVCLYTKSWGLSVAANVSHQLPYCVSLGLSARFFV